MSIPLNDNIKIVAGKPSDAKYLNASNNAYADAAEVLTTIPITQRSIGLTVLVVGGVEYWFKDGVDDSDLVIKSSGGGGEGTAFLEQNYIPLAGSDKIFGDLLSNQPQIVIGSNSYNSNSTFYYDANYSQHQTAVYTPTNLFSLINMNGDTINNTMVMGVGVYDNNDATRNRSLDMSLDQSILFSGAVVNYDAQDRNAEIDSNPKALITNEWFYLHLPSSSSGASYTFINGLINDSSTVKLGGELTEDTYLFGKTIITGSDIDGNVYNGDLFFGANQTNNIDNSNISFSAKFYDGQTFNGVSSNLFLNSGTLASDPTARIEVAKMDGSIYSQLDSTPSTFTFSVLDFSSNDRIFKQELGNPFLLTGSDIQYYEDYSASYTNRSLVDKEYVDNAIASSSSGGGSYTFQNGLTLDTGNVKLGGELTESTYIYGTQDIFIGQDPTSVNAGDVYISAKAKTDGLSSTLQLATYSYNSTYIAGLSILSGDEGGNQPQVNLVAQNESLSSQIQIFPNRLDIFVNDLVTGAGPNINLRGQDTFIYNTSEGVINLGYSSDYAIMPNTINIASGLGGIQILSTTATNNHNSNLTFTADDGSNGATVLFNAINNLTTDNSFFKATAESLKFLTHSSSGESWINLNSEIINSTHIKYDQDYSSLYTSRSLVDKAYVDGIAFGSAGAFLPLTGSNDISGNFRSNTNFWQLGLSDISNSFQIYNFSGGNSGMTFLTGGSGTQTMNLYTDQSTGDKFFNVGSASKSYSFSTNQPHTFNGDDVEIADGFGTITTDIVTGVKYRWVAANGIPTLVAV